MGILSIIGTIGLHIGSAILVTVIPIHPSPPDTTVAEMKLTKEEFIKECIKFNRTVTYKKESKPSCEVGGSVIIMK